MASSRTKLQRLHADFNQSPWLDDLKRAWITSGALAEWVERGVRGVTSNPTTFHKAISLSDDYDQQFRDLMNDGASVEACYWAMVQTDITAALGLLRPVYDASDTDGFVSVELAPDLAHDPGGSISAARLLHEAIAEPNLLVKIPGTAEGVSAIEALIGEGRNVNVTLLFGLQRYAEVMEAYLRGLESLADAGGDVSRVRSVASFFVSRVDAEVDSRLEGIGGEVRDLLGRAAVANARLAYARFQQVFRGERWQRLQALSAQPQRPLWASMAPKNATYLDTLYVDSLIGPDTVSTMPEPILQATEQHGTLARTVDSDLDDAQRVFDKLRQQGIDMDDVAATLEDQGVAAFDKSYNDLLGALQHKADQLGCAKAGRSDPASSARASIATRPQDDASDNEDDAE